MTYSDALLDRMRHVGDPSADSAIEALAAGGEMAALNDLLRGLVMNEQPVPEDLPAAVAAWLRESEELPGETDLDRLDRGRELVARHTPQVALILSTASLVSCYGHTPG